MKKILFTLIAFGFLYSNASAQYCGNSGVGICDTILLDAPGFSPPTDSLISMVNGDVSTTVIYFQNYDSVAGSRMNSLKIDTIDNLPAGICWSMSDPNNTFGNKQNGCIKLSGTPCSAPGQYRIRIKATINGFLKLDLATQGLKYYVRVINNGDTPTPVDTNQAVAFVGYGGSATNCTNSIKDESLSLISSLNVYPNPMSNYAEIKFVSAKTGTVTERITNILGGEVLKTVKEVKTGNNLFTLERNSLPAGVYFYSLVDGRNIITKRLIISE